MDSCQGENELQRYLHSLKKEVKGVNEDFKLFRKEIKSWIFKIIKGLGLGLGLGLGQRLRPLKIGKRKSTGCNSLRPDKGKAKLGLGLISPLRLPKLKWRPKLHLPVFEKGSTSGSVSLSNRSPGPEETLILVLVTTAPKQKCMQASTEHLEEISDLSTVILVEKATGWVSEKSMTRAESVEGLEHGGKTQITTMGPLALVPSCDHGVMPTFKVGFVEAAHTTSPEVKRLAANPESPMESTIGAIEETQDLNKGLSLVPLSPLNNKDGSSSDWVLQKVNEIQHIVGISHG
ncbi:hypothetical protein F2P56_004464, partial [Juglans regia]